MLLGHSDITTTVNIYAHLFDGDLCVRDEHSFDKQEVGAGDAASFGKINQIKIV
ncbi:MAG: hypothetical protein HY072_04695 [Deltaproteobacteria bacterium]|nr:hypothetical protein [Deltaproteobacteria bacterium]